MYLMKNFQKGGGMGEVLKLVTLDGGLRKKAKKKILFFAAMTCNKTFFG